MKKGINVNDIASRMRILRKQKNLSTREMASHLGIDMNNYRKYERALYSPQLHIQVLLSQKFGVSLDWLILNKGPMYITEIETALRENERLKQEEKQKPAITVEPGKKIIPEPTVPPDAVIVTSPEIKELFHYMEGNPLFKFKLLTHFYRYKQAGRTNGEISFEDPRHEKETD